MKVKGMNPAEQHVEKAVLALVALALLAVLAVQFLTQPNQVEVGPNNKVPPQNVYVELQRQAESIDSQLKDAAPALPEVRPTDLAQRYNRAMDESQATTLALTAPLGPGVRIGSVTGADLGVAGPSSDEVAPLAVPRTTAPVAASQWGALDPYALLAVPELAEFVPQEQPFDLPSVTIETTFSGVALRDALSPAQGAGVPRRFWAATGMAILGLDVQRQRLMPDGSWSEPESITTPPGTPKPTGALTPEAGLPQLTELVNKATQAAADVQRPLALPTIAGPEWIPPSERADAATGAQLTEADRLRRQLERAVAELDRLENPTRQPQDVRNDPGGARRVTTTTTTTTPGRDDRNQRRIAQLREEIQTLRNRLRDMGESDPTAPATTGARGTRPADTQAAPALLERPSVQLWAHDLGVEPGATYRYRTRVVVNNPLFRKGPVLDPNDETLQTAAADPFSRGEWSDWSEPVVVGATEYYFVTGADAEGALTGGQAGVTVEIFKMHYGFYRKSTLNLAPGDPVVTSIRMPDGLFVIDTAQIEPAQAVAAISATTPGPLPPGITRASGRLPVRLGAIVLEVATRSVQATDNLGQTVTVTEVTVRDRDGRVLVRSAKADAESPAYRLANASSAAASRSTLREPGQPAKSPSAELFAPPAAQP